MNKLSLFLITLLPCFAVAQSTAFYNQGSTVYIQKGALLEVQGNFANDSGAIENDGIIELQGNFQNGSNAGFAVYNDSTSTERAVKFVGTGTQAIIGNMGNNASASFYNLVVDKTSAADQVQMQTNVNVQGSLVFGTTSFTSTYNTSNLYTNNNQKGLLATYAGSTEYNLNILNGNTDAIAGYPAMVMNGAPNTGYILTSGIRGSANGGLQRQVSAATAYDFPIGTTAHGFNAMRLNFMHIPTGGGMVMGKFNDGSDNPNGSIGSLSTQCIGCSDLNQAPANSGFSKFFSSNPCNNNTPQWVMLDDAIKNHGYWSFASTTNSSGFNYSVEAFANNYTMEGTAADIWRTLQYKAPYGFNPTFANITWNNDIDSTASQSDLLAYSRNTGDCYTGAGVPGGEYSDFGQFAMKKSDGGGALPVKMLYVNATPAAQNIVVSWATALEVNNNGFEVEKSADGVNFTGIGWVKGHDNSTTQQNYSLTDINVDPNVVYYYRLNQIDNNGNSMLSDIAAAEVTAGNADAAFDISEPMPNPASTSSRLVITTNVSQAVFVKIYSLSGQVVFEQPYSVSAGSNTVNLDVQSFASGTYSAVIQAGEKSYSKMLVVSR